MGVRISWLMLARNSLLAGWPPPPPPWPGAAPSVCFRSVMSRKVTTMPPTAGSAVRSLNEASTTRQAAVRPRHAHLGRGGAAPPGRRAASKAVGEGRPVVGMDQVGQLAGPPSPSNRAAQQPLQRRAGVARPAASPSSSTTTSLTFSIRERKCASLRRTAVSSASLSRSSRTPTSTEHVAERGPAGPPRRCRAGGRSSSPCRPRPPRGPARPGRDLPARPAQRPRDARTMRSNAAASPTRKSTAIRPTCQSMAVPDRGADAAQLHADVDVADLARQRWAPTRRGSRPNSATVSVRTVVRSGPPRGRPPRRARAGRTCGRRSRPRVGRRRCRRPRVSAYWSIIAWTEAVSR